MATYSLSLTALADGYTTANEAYTIPDSVVGGGATLVTGQLGGVYNAASGNDPLLVKGPDGSFGLYTIDAERSNPANLSLPIYLKKM